MKPLNLISFACKFCLLTLLVLTPPIHAQSWQAKAGAQSHDLGRQADAFLPNEIWIHEGDSITWTVDSNGIHTVTFLVPQPAQIRPTFRAGCPVPPGPQFFMDSASFNGSTCVTTPALSKGQTFTVTFPDKGNFKLVCLVHTDMTGTVHVLDRSLPLPHDQDFYNNEAEVERLNLLTDREAERDPDTGSLQSSSTHEVTAGTGETAATPGGAQHLSVMRFWAGTKVIHAGETVEWTNTDPMTRHTITFGTEPSNFMLPSSNVSVDADGARSATINSPSDNVNSGIIVASLPERVGVAQAALGVTRFRVKFTQPGTYPYICAIHDNLGMKGEVIVLP